MQALGNRKPVSRRDRWSWYFYDFGNSAYAAVIILAVYVRYFQDGVVGGEQGTRLWGYAVGIAMAIVAITSPILGAIADFSASKKRLLFLFTALSVVFTGLLYFVEPGDIVIGILFFVLAEIGYRSAQTFYNGLLPEIAEPHEIGRVSGTGWAIGSLGGIVCLLIVLPLIVVLDNNWMVRFSNVITAVFFAASAIPLFLWLRERGVAQQLPPGENYVTIAFRRLWRTGRRARHYGEFMKFLLASIFFNNAIMMIMNFAAIIGGVLFGLNQVQLIILIILVQITNVLGAFAFGEIVDRISAKAALFGSLAILVVVVLLLTLVEAAALFFVLAAVAGFAMAGAQSVARTVVGQLSPPGQSAEFYGLFAVADRSSSFIGPAVFGQLAFWATRTYELQAGVSNAVAQQWGIRAALWSIVVFLALGALALVVVDEKRGIAAAYAPAD